MALMMDEKHALPPYSPADEQARPVLVAAPRPFFRPNIRRRMRFMRRLKYVAFAFLGLLVLGQWSQIWRAEVKAPMLSVEKLNDDLAICKKLRSKPQDPIGLGREKNARYIDGKPYLLKNATIWTGEPAKGTSEAEARAGKGWSWITGDVFVESGLIQKVEASIATDSLPDDTVAFDVQGRQLTAGIIDMHSHTGVYSLPSLSGNSDGNEMSDNITPWARSIDGIYPFDPQIKIIKSGGVTTSLVLPGSGNNIGGEAYMIKHAVGKEDGRKELSVSDLIAAPESDWRYMKMACGENAKRSHGGIGKRPFSRMGEAYDFRHAFEQAQALNQKQDDWCDKAEAVGVENMEEYLPQEIFWETLGAALRGKVHINTHCYTVPDLSTLVGITNEFKFPIRAFHHAHQTFLVPEILKRTWGGRPPSSAIFADNMYYKTESYVGSEYAGKELYKEGLTPVYVSDNPVLNAQHVVFEAAKGYHYGLPYHAAMASVTTAPADDLGMGQRLGKIKPGFDADLVVWDSDPLSVGATPIQVWIDGVEQFEDPIELAKPLKAPTVPDDSLSVDVEEPVDVADVIFTGINKVLLSDEQAAESTGKEFSVAITNGKVSCIGACESEIQAAASSQTQVVALENGYLFNAYTGVAGMIGLNEIDNEKMTDNGDNPTTFSRAADGLMLDSKKLHVALKYGVTRAISAPRFNGGGTHHGTSVGFLTSALTPLDNGAVFDPDVAVHYTLDMTVRSSTSYSAAFGELRSKLLEANSTETKNPFSETAFLKKVIAGETVLALTIQSADGISSALKIKSEVETILDTTINMAIIGGAESWMVAPELAAASVGVVLVPLNAMGATWDSRRALSGAPLTNGTAVDYLVGAGVTVAAGLKEDWYIRDLGFEAGTAYKNGNGKFSEKAALDLVSTNVYKIFGAEAGEMGLQHFIVSEGSPLEVGSRTKAVGSGRSKVAVFM